MSRAGRMKWGLGVALIAMLAAVAAPVHAQAPVAGGIGGTVQDVTGAVLVGAEVVLKNAATGDVRRATTNSSGVFMIVGVPVGTYEITFKYTGMTPLARKGLVVHPGDRLNLSDIKLSAGQTEVVTVVANAGELTPKDSGEKSFTITSDQIENIAVVGRSASELVKILPGVVPLTVNNRPGYTGEVVGLKSTAGNAVNQISDNTVQTGFAISGARPDAIDVTVDGAPASDRTRLGNVANPNIEMTQEFKVLVSNFSAEHSRGPVSVSAVSKSGGRDFHGTLYTSLRHYSLNANDWSQNKQNLERPETQFLYPGFNIGGPVLIPGTDFNKDRNKLFFFVGYEYAFQEFDYFRRGWTYFPEMLDGDFSRASWLAPSKNGTVSTVPTGGRVPVDPYGYNLAKLYPAATVTDQATLATNGGFNWVANPTRQSNMAQLLARLDYSVSDNTKLFLRYNRQRERQDQPISVYGVQNERNLPWPTGLDGENYSDGVSATLTHVFSPTLTAEVIGTYTRFGIRNEPQDYAKMTNAGVGFPYGMYWPQEIVPNIQGDAATWAGEKSGPIMFNPGGGAAISQDKQFYTAAVAITKVIGSHTVKVGGNFDLYQDEFKDPWVSNGEILMGKIPGENEGTWGDWSKTNNVLADLISGYASGFAQDSSPQPKSYKGKSIEGYVQDSWKIRPNLTVDAGVRFSYLSPWEDRNGVGSGVWFGPEAYAADVAKYGDSYHLPGVRWNARDASVPLSGIERSSVFFSPRVGFAWDTTSKGNTVVRGGVGVYRYMEEAFRLTEMLEGPAGFWNISNLGNARSFAQLEAEAKAAATAAGGQPPKPTDGWGATVWNKDDDQMPITYNWSFTVQQKLPLSMSLEASYVGNYQDYILMGTGDANMANINFAYGFQGPKPYANYNGLNLVGHLLNQNYHAGQFLLARHRGPLTFMASYTFSKNLGYRGYGYGSGSYAGQIMDPDYSKRLEELRKTDYGVLGFDRTHTLNVSYSYRLPELKDKAGLVRGLAGGWQVSGVTTFFTGTPIQEGNFKMSGTNAAGTNLRPGDIISGFPQGTENSLNFTLYPVITCDPRKDVPSGSYFNTACFAAPNANEYGNGMMPDMRASSYVNNDLSLFKNFPLGGPRKLQLRISAYNVLNQSSTAPIDGRNLKLEYKNGVISNPEFGQIPVDEEVKVDGKSYMSGANKYGRRIVQVALKFFF